jgi:hypothetical protein
MQFLMVKRSSANDEWKKIAEITAENSASAIIADQLHALYCYHMLHDTPLRPYAYGIYDEATGETVAVDDNGLPLINSV